MNQRYATVVAKTYKEAVEKSPFFNGQKAHVSDIQASANSDGTFSVFAEFELDEQKEESANVGIRL